MPAISPDGQYLAYTWGPAGSRTVSLHRMADPEGAPLAAFVGGSYPFFFRDSAWLGFFPGGELRKVPVLGGIPQTLARANASRGARWGDDNRIVFAPSFRSPLLRVPADGGVPETLTTLDALLDESSHRQPQVLPGSRAVVFTAYRTRGSAVVVASLETGERRLTIRGGGSRPVRLNGSSGVRARRTPDDDDIPRFQTASFMLRRRRLAVALL